MQEQEEHRHFLRQEAASGNALSPEQARQLLRYHDLFDSLPEAVMVNRTSDEVIVDVNRRFCEITGIPREQALGSRSDVLGLWSEEPGRGEFWATLLREGSIRDYNFVLRHRDGTLRSGLVSSVILQEGTEEIVLSVFSDITVQRQVEQNLQSRLEFEELLSSLSALFISLPPHEVDTWIKNGLARIHNFLQGDLTGLLEVSEEGSEVWLSHRCPDESFPLPFEPRSDMAPRFPWLRKCLVDEGKVFCASSLDDFPPEAAIDRESHAHAGFSALLCIPIKVAGRVSHMIYVNHVQPRECPPHYISRLQVLGEVFANALVRFKAHQEALRAKQEIEQLKDQLEAEASFLRSEIETIHRHAEILGTSPAIQQTLQLIAQAGPSDSHVLILGETGTGKELVAKAIHAASKRRDRNMVTVNCAALPATLIESELFGREKGSYTGALTRQMGRFEFADNGTIFLDEIGELPLELQSKLLRVLQEGEFERIGSPKTHRVNVRIVAATNRDLAELVRRGDFRKDLYFRLSVFPIEVPPLRERTSDIPILVWAFTEEFSKKMGKKIDSVSNGTMRALQEHPWPGNVRELRNAVERAMIQNQSTRLEVPVPQTRSGLYDNLGSLEEMERKYILHVLDKTNWRIKGADGAAELLGLKPSTLYSRLDRLGITRR